MSRVAQRSRSDEAACERQCRHPGNHSSLTLGIRDIPCYLNAQAEHLLDWFHLTMRITVMANMAKSLPPPSPGPEFPDTPPTDLANEIAAQLERLKWFCWHGNVFRALQTIDDILVDLDITEPGPEQARLLKAVREFDSYIRANAGRIPNYGNASVLARPSPPRSPSPQSTRSSAISLIGICECRGRRTTILYWQRSLVSPPGTG